MTDRLSLANALAEAKIERSAAERIATDPRATERRDGRSQRGQLPCVR